MYKNMTRKGLALGAGLALAASGLVAAPAQAAATGLLWSYYGQSDEMVAVNGENFTLRIGNPTATKSFADADIVEADAVVIAQVPKSGQAAKTLTAVATTGEDGVVLAITSPVATETYQYDIKILYADGAESETERVTFVPATDVSASITVAPVTVGDSADLGGNTFTLTGINTENFLKSNGMAAGGASGAAVDTKFGVAVTNTDAATSTATSKTTKSWTYDVLTDSYSFAYTSAIVAGDIIKASLNLWSGSASVEANTYFDATATAAEGKFTVASASAYNSMDISTATGTSVVHNKNATQAAGSAVPAETVIALEGTKSMNFVIQAYTDGATRSVAASSGIPITVTLTDDANKIGTTTLTAGGKSLDVTGTSISFTLTTNSSGQVAFTVAADKAVAGESFTIGAKGSLSAASSAILDTTTVKWEEASWTLLPAVDGNFSIAPGGSLAVDYTVVDQFGNLAGTEYQLAITRTANAAVAANRDKLAEYANWSYVAPVSATGRASATIVDNGLAATEGSDTVTVSLQKAASAGGAYIAAANSTADTFVLTYENDLASLTSTAKVSYNGIANAAGTAVAPIYIESDPLYNYDNRTTALRPTKWDQYNVEADGVVADANDLADAMLRVYGTVVTTGNAPVSGVAVKLSAAGLNFADNAAVASMTRASNDSIVVFTDATGSYEAFVRSATTGNVTIAVDAQGATSSVEVRFQSSTGVATGLTLVGPTSVASGARADFTATVVDKYGKAVSGVAVTFKDNGPGVLNTTTAVNTDAFGEAQATLTTLAAEKGTTVVTAYATIGGVLVTQTATITVGTVAAADAKVNAGSFKGYVAVYAKGYKGSRLSAKVGKDWVIVPALASDFVRVVEFTGAGVDVAVRIYIDRVLVDTINLTTK